MPIFIYDSDAFDKLVSVEGESWRRYQLDHEKDCFSVSTWVRAWNSMKGQGLDCAPENFSPGFVFDCISDGTLYGEGGYARYIVRSDGEICLLGSSTRKERQDLAREIGFSVV